MLQSTDTCFFFLIKILFPHDFAYFVSNLNNVILLSNVNFKCNIIGYYISYNYIYIFLFSYFKLKVLINLLFKSNYFNSALNILRFHKSHVLFLIYINFMFIWKNNFFSYMRNNSRHYIKKKPDLSLKGKRYKKHWGPIFFFKSIKMFLVSLGTPISVRVECKNVCYPYILFQRNAYFPTSRFF